MKTKTVIESNVDKLMGMDFLFFNDNDNGWFINDEESIREAIKEYGDEFPAKLLYDIHKAFHYLANEIVEKISPDLKDIWERMDKLEKLIKSND